MRSVDIYNNKKVRSVEKISQNICVSRKKDVTLQRISNTDIWKEYLNARFMSATKRIIRTKKITIGNNDISNINNKQKDNFRYKLNKTGNINKDDNFKINIINI